MKNSFQKLWEDAKAGRDFWDSPVEEDDGKVQDLIRRGLEIRPDRRDGETFWDDFLAVFGNNSEAASRLLDTTPENVSRWSSKIRKELEHVRTDNDRTESKKKKMLSTGGI